MVQRVGNAVYCTADDILSGSYRPALIEVMSEIPAYWKAVGLSGTLFAQPVDNAMLRAYYQQADDLEILSLFPAYFTEEFASDKEILIAHETAVSLADYIIHEHGMNTFLSEDRPADRQAWLQTLGINRDYSDPYADTLAAYRYEFWKDDYLLVVTTDRGDTMYMQFMEDDLESPADLRSFLYEANIGVQAMLDGIAMEAPEYLQTVLHNYRKQVSVYFDPTAVYNFASWTEMKIMLLNSYAYLHEMAHILTYSSSQEAKSYARERWQYEAIAEYLSVSFYQMPCMKRYVYSLWESIGDRINDSDPLTDVWDAFEARIIEKHQQIYGDFPQNWEDLDVALYWKAKAYMQTQEILANPGVKLEWIYSLGDLTNRNGRMCDGDELTYKQAYSLADYLIETHGLSVFFAYCIEDTSFEEAFGLTYEEVKALWIAYTESSMN